MTWMTSSRQGALVFWVLGCLTLALRAPGAVLHVTPEGDDAAEGTAAKPFRTAVRARDVLRSLSTEQRAGSTVLMHAGDYELTATLELGPEDGGTPDRPVRYCAEGSVCLIGGERLRPEHITAVTDETLRQRLPETARSRVLQLDLGHLKNAGKLGELPDLWRDPPGLSEFSWNGQMLHYARWPNRDWTTVTEVISETPPVIRFSGDRPLRWSVTAGVWLHGYWFYEWIDETVRVVRIDPGSRQIELAVRPPYRGMGADKGCLRRFRAINVLEELDEPGEVWFDPSGGLAVLWPPDTAEDPRLVVSTLVEPIVKLADCSHVELRGFVVESGRNDGIVIAGGANNSVLDCEVRNVGGVGIRVTGANHTIRSCHVHHTGATGVDLDGGNRIELAASGNVVENCDIHHPGRIKQTYSPCIQLSGCGQTARHNRVHDGPHIGIAFKGNNHLIELNEVDHVCTDSGDVAAIYSANSPGYRGTVIRHNFIHHIPLKVRYGATGVYLDNALCGNVVSGNVFFRACDGSGKASTYEDVVLHHGYQNLVENNIFVDCGRAVGASLFHDAKWDSYKAGVLKRLDPEGRRGLATEKWLETYREQPKPGYGMAEFRAWRCPDNCLDRLNPTERNLVVACGTAFGRYLAEADNVVTDDLGVFLDARSGDLRLRPDAPRPAGFETIPFTDIGLRRDETRKHVPARRWQTTPPVASAGRNRVHFDRDSDGKEIVPLDASDSLDSDGRELHSFLWLRNGDEIARGRQTVAELPLGQHRITCRVMDYDGYWSEADVRVSVLKGEREPELRAGASAGCPSDLIALPNTYMTPIGTALNVQTTDGLLANDGDAGTPRDIEILKSPTRGQLDCSQDGSFRYAPPPDWEGVAGFAYRIRTANEFSNAATVEISVGTTRGFIWDRSAEWTPGTVVGKSDGNPDDDILGRPVWLYGSTTNRGDRWFAAQPARHVWDREWCAQSGNSCWVRADDKGPFFRPQVVFQTDSEDFPLIRWRNPTNKRLRLRVAGEIAVAWFLTPEKGTSTTLVLAADSGDGSPRAVLQKRWEGKPKERVVHQVDVVLEVAPHAVVVLASRTEDTGTGWVTTTDDLTYMIEGMFE